MVIFYSTPKLHFDGLLHCKGTRRHLKFSQFSRGYNSGSSLQDFYQHVPLALHSAMYGWRKGLAVRPSVSVPIVTIVRNDHCADLYANWIEWRTKCQTSRLQYPPSWQELSSTATKQQSVRHLHRRLQASVIQFLVNWLWFSSMSRCCKW